MEISPICFLGAPLSFAPNGKHAEPSKYIFTYYFLIVSEPRQHPHHYANLAWVNNVCNCYLPSGEEVSSDAMRLSNSKGGERMQETMMHSLMRCRLMTLVYTIESSLVKL
jgi:hypothetical protein